MRLIEVRLLEGPNVYRLQPVVKVDVAVGRTRAWKGSRTPDDGALVHLARPVPVRGWPDPVADLVAWTRRLRADHGEHGGPVEVHRASDAGRWVVTWPWEGAERARLIAEAAADLAGRSACSSSDELMRWPTLLRLWQNRMWLLTEEDIALQLCQTPGGALRRIVRFLTLVAHRADHRRRTL